MEKDVAKIRKMLKEIDEKYDKDPEVVEDAEEYHKKYATVDEKDLHTPFTI